MKGALTEWDVVNEAVDNRDLQSVLGEGFLRDMFRAAKQADPKAARYLNEYSILSGGGLMENHQKSYERIIRFIDDGEDLIDGIGMQSHFGADLTPPERIWKILDRFGTLGNAIRITEFDVAADDPEAEGDYVRDFITSIFAHPAVTGFIMWGFWEKDHWRPRASLVAKDWSLRPSGQAYLDLIHRVFHTEKSGTTDGSGRHALRGFRGQYEVSWVHQGRKYLERITLNKAGGQVVLTVK